jgi:hypothetical protein
MVVSCINKNLDYWLRARESRRIGDRGKGDECRNKMTSLTKGEYLKTWHVKEIKQGMGIDSVYTTNS